MNGLTIHNRIREHAVVLIAFQGAIVSLSGMGQSCFKINCTESAIQVCQVTDDVAAMFESRCATTPDPVIAVLFREYLRIKTELRDMLQFDFAEVRP